MPLSAKRRSGLKSNSRLQGARIMRRAPEAERLGSLQIPHRVLTLTGRMKMIVSRTLVVVCISLALALVSVFVQARELGDMDGRWMFIAGSSNGAEEFIDPASIVLERQFNAWSCWVRILDPKRREE